MPTLQLAKTIVDQLALSSFSPFRFARQQLSAPCSQLSPTVEAAAA
jgi:hypothetical protein